MNVKYRRLFAALTTLTWVAWLTACWAGYQFPVGPGHKMATEVLRVVAVLAAIILAMVYVVAPMVSAMRIGMDIGRDQQERNCKCGELRESNGKVISINRIRVPRRD